MKKAGLVVYCSIIEQYCPVFEQLIDVGPNRGRGLCTSRNL